MKCSKASGTSKSKGVKKHTKSDPIYNETLPKAAMGTRIELGQREDTDGASLLERRSMRSDAYGKMTNE